MKLKIILPICGIVIAGSLLAGWRLGLFGGEDTAEVTQGFTFEEGDSFLIDDSIGDTELMGYDAEADFTYDGSVETVGSFQIDSGDSTFSEISVIESDENVVSALGDIGIGTAINTVADIGIGTAVNTVADFSIDTGLTEAATNTTSEFGVGGAEIEFGTSDPLAGLLVTDANVADTSVDFTDVNMGTPDVELGQDLNPTSFVDTTTSDIVVEEEIVPPPVVEEPKEVVPAKTFDFRNNSNYIALSAVLVCMLLAVIIRKSLYR